MKKTNLTRLAALLLATSMTLLSACSSSDDNDAADETAIEDADSGNTGNENTGNENTGNENTGNENTGNENTGNENTGNENTGNENIGNENTGNENTGNENTGNENTGNEDTGNEDTDNENTDNENTGNENTGNEDTDNENTDNENTGNENTDNENTGNEPPMQDDSSQIADENLLQYAYVFARAPDYSSARVERISISDGNVVDGTYPGSTSDHTIATDGEALYQIGRFNIDTVTKFDAVDTSAVNYQLSILAGEPRTSNPQSLAFANTDRAYLTRRNSDTLLILDPTPEEKTSSSLIKGNISLGDYNRTIDGAIDFPDMTDAIVVDEKLFVLLENLDGFAALNTGYIAVFDLTDNTEIDTGKGRAPLKGIQLQTRNPSSLQYNKETELLYVTGRGNFFRSAAVPGDPFTGGIESIDPDTFDLDLILDDGTDTDNQGFFNDTVVVNSNLGYLITLEGYNNDGSSISNLRTFNPATGELSGPIPGTEGQSLTTLSIGTDNHLWVGIQDTTPGFMRINLASNEIVGERVATTLVPAKVVFINVEK